MAGGETPMAGGRQAGGIVQRSCLGLGDPVKLDGRCSLEAHSPDLRHFHMRLPLKKHGTFPQRTFGTFPQRTCGTFPQRTCPDKERHPESTQGR
jgi:hypothetical protein